MTNVPDPGWKGQPDTAEREPDPCEVCGGLGFLADQSYHSADIPDDFMPVQRCDACSQFDRDEGAAMSAANYYELDEVRWFDGEDEAPGDWAIGPIVKHEENP